MGTDVATEPLRVGDLVEVRTADEILATLDEDGTVDRLPFMPEMLRFCGGRYRVTSRAHKTCDSIEFDGLRRMHDTVHLDLRCDGEAHGGCQTGCLLFWKEQWLRRVDDATPSGEPTGHNPAGRSWLEGTAVKARDDDGAVYRCQATELKAATRPLPWWEPTQYVRDIRDNGVPVREVISGLGIATYNKVQHARGRPGYPNVTGTLRRTPTSEPLFEAGDWAEVKSHEEILATLDRNGRNRGLTFDTEMVPFCGGRYRVLRVVERVIDERTGRLLELPGRSVILETVVCEARYHRFCPRRTYSFWREIWLRPATAPTTSPG